MIVDIRWTHAAAGLALVLALGIALVPGTPAPPAVLPAPGTGIQPDLVSARELAGWTVVQRKDISVVDLRANWQFEDYHIPGARSIPPAKLRGGVELAGLPRSGTVILYAGSTEGAVGSWSLLKEHGYRARVLAGGIPAWWAQVMTPGTLDSAETNLSARAQAAHQRSLRGYLWSAASGNRAPGPPPLPATPAPGTTNPGLSSEPAPAVPPPAPSSPAGHAVKIPGATC